MYACLFIVVLLVLVFQNTIMINVIAAFSVQRGILSPNEFWWSMTDFLHDSTGVELFYKIKQTHPYFYETTLLGTPMVLVLDMNATRFILDNSPDLFTVGTLKRNFFGFMRHNVGVLSGCKWQQMRHVNENVLDTGNTHRFSARFRNIISGNLLEQPTCFSEFSASAKDVTNMIVFGTRSNEPVYDAIREANRIPIFRRESQQGKQHIAAHLNDAAHGTLLGTLAELGGEHIVDQVYHFVFPMMALISIHVPRILSLIVSHENVKARFVGGVEPAFLRKCILETFRLNSPVLSFFRRSTQQVLGYPQGTEFLILSNPILRNADVFQQPDEFVPDRWTDALTRSHFNIVFGLGPQRCPGKDLSLDILQCYITAYLSLGLGFRLQNENVLFFDRPRVKYAINPYKLRFVH